MNPNNPEETTPTVNQNPQTANEPDTTLVAPTPPAAEQQNDTTPEGMQSADTEVIVENENQTSAQSGQVNAPIDTQQSSSAPVEQLQTTVAPAVVPTGEAHSPKSRKKLLVGLTIGVAAALLIGGGAALAYFGVYVPNRPENVLKTALFNTMDTNEVKLDGSFETKTNGDPDMVAMKIDFDGGSNMTKKTSTGTVTMTVSGVEFEFDIRMLDDNIYVRVGDLSTISGLITSMAGNSSQEAVAISQLMNQASDMLSNQWIVFDSTLLDQAGMSCVTNMQYTITDADKKLLEEQYQKHAFVTINSNTSEEVNGRDMYKYDLTVDHKKGSAYMRVLEKLSFVKEATKGCEDSTDELDKQLQSEDVVTEGSTDLTVWVDKSDKRIAKIAADDISLSEDSKASGTFTLAMLYEGVSVEKPADAKPAMEVFMELQGLFSEAPMGF